MSDDYGDTGAPSEPSDPLFRPVWEDTPDESELQPGRGIDIAADPNALAPRRAREAWWWGEEFATLAAVLCDAQDALARLDAAAAAAPAAVREGLCARMAFAEAAGWLAYAHAWVHPLDLALRDLGLTGSYAIATRMGRPLRDMPNTYVRRLTRAWEEQDTAEMLAGEAAVATALALARQLLRVARTREDPFGTVAGASAALNQFAPAGLDSARFHAWRAEIERAGNGAPGKRLPALLAAARAAECWVSGGIVEVPGPLQAFLAAACVMVGRSAVRAVLPPLWSAYTALGQPAAGQEEILPLLRGDVAVRLGLPSDRRSSPPGWLLAFLHLLAEGARAAMRELEKLLDVAGRGRAIVADRDRRARLPAALEAALRVPVLTPKGLAAGLAVAPQTATALLRELRAARLVTEITGRRSFRAFAVIVS